MKDVVSERTSLLQGLTEDFNVSSHRVVLKVQMSWPCVWSCCVEMLQGHYFRGELGV